MLKRMFGKDKKVGNSGPTYQLPPYQGYGIPAPPHTVDDDISVINSEILRQFNDGHTVTAIIVGYGVHKRLATLLGAEVGTIINYAGAIIVCDPSASMNNIVVAYEEYQPHSYEFEGARTPKDVKAKKPKLTLKELSASEDEG